MCGIAGIFAYGRDALAVSRHELIKIRDSMAARGPDGEGLWFTVDGRIGLAHRRLAIIDLTESGSQPMQSARSAHVITFNGEIYNHKELRRELEVHGYRFKSTSDTEVILALYDQVGERMVSKLRGMFAFAIWDDRNRQIFLARDPFGIKPLYYCDDGGTLRFASQVKALAQANSVRLTPSPTGHAGFFVFGYVPEPHTLYQQIRALPAGSTLTAGIARKPKIQTFYDVRERLVEAQNASQNNLSASERGILIATALRESVADHLVSDVPVGLFLSSGIDSSTIASAMRMASNAEFLAVTMGFREFVGSTDDEVPLARAQAERLNIEHVARWVSREEFYEDLPKLWASMDQPSIDGVSSWLVAKAAAERKLKVVLSGLGGDELFGGYPGFHQIPRLLRHLAGIRIPRSIRGGYRSIVRAVPERLISAKYAYALDHLTSVPDAYLLRRALFLPEELTKFLDPEIMREGLQELDALQELSRSVEGIHNPHTAIASLELNWFMRSQLLRDMDWAGMAHGVEIRVPMVDTRFFESVAPLLASSQPPTKADLTHGFTGVLHPQVLVRPKTGFSTPVRNWLATRYQSVNRHRGLRAWSRVVYAEFMQELSLLPADPIAPRLVSKGLVMVYRIGQLGDSLVSLPALQAIRQKYADSQIVLLTDRQSKGTGFVSAWDVVGPTGFCDGVMYYDVFNDRLRNLLVYLRLRNRIRRLGPRVFINLAPRTRPWDEIRDRLFFRNLCRIPVYTALAATPNPIRGAVKSVEAEWLRLVKAIDSTANQSFSLTLPQWAINEASRQLPGPGQSSPRLIAICPGSKMPAKRWPLDRFREVGAKILNADDNAVIVVLGAAEDVPLGDELCQAWGERSYNLAGRLSVFGSAAVLAKCSLYVGNDSGAMHLAGIVGTPCVALFSARDDLGRWEPYGTRHQVLRSTVACGGCMLEACDRDNLCLALISANDVINACHRDMRRGKDIGPLFLVPAT